MDESTSIVPYLFLVTFLIAIVIGIFQYGKVIKARRERHRSVSAVVNGEPRKPVDEGDRREPVGRRV